MRFDTENILHIHHDGYKIPSEQRTDIQRVHIHSKVSEIGFEQFLHCTYLVEVIIDNGPKLISQYAFGGCTSLRRIRIPSSIWYVDMGAFCQCESLAELDLGDGVIAVGDRICTRCTQLREIKIPPSTILIDKDALDYSPVKTIQGILGSCAEDFAKQEGIAFQAIGDPLEEHGSCGSNMQWNYDRRTRTLYIFGEGRMYDYGWKNRAPWRVFPFRTVIIEDKVESLGRAAFLMCFTMEKIWIGRSVSEIEPNTFQACWNLGEIRIHPDNRIIKFENGRMEGKDKSKATLPYYLSPDECGEEEEWQKTCATQLNISYLKHDSEHKASQMPESEHCFEKKLLVFDIYGTLLDIHTQDENPDVWEAVKKIIALKTGTRPEESAEEIKKQFFLFREKCVVELKREQALSGCQNEEYVEYDDMVVFRRLLEYLGAYGADDLIIEQIAKIYRISATQRISIYPDVEYTLAVLKKVGYNLAILSNAQRVYVEEDIGNLFKYFDHIYILSEHGIKKPSTRFYQKLLNEAQVKPEEAVYCCQLYDPACFECFQHPGDVYFLCGRYAVHSLCNDGYCDFGCFSLGISKKGN